MRDPELMLSLLREMAARDDGRIVAVLTFEPRVDAERRYHHLELLVDADHALWTSMGVVRITNAGYDFIAAVDHGEGVHKKFLALLERGLPYLPAAKGALEILDAVG